jgi:hypothetical protein
MDSKDAPVVFDGVCRHMPQKAIGSILQLSSIRRISFITPPDRRATLVEQAKALYSAFLGAPDRDDPAFKCGDFVSTRLGAKPEESDVVHYLLAHLAERMIEMNKEKNSEIKSFLEFLKGDIGVSVDDLSNKTAIQEYYSHEFQNLIDVLAKNKKKLKAGYDPKSPTNYKHLQQWYNDSTGKLKPLMGRIEATDGLIDQIVYKLYGLTEDEIKIVEGSRIRRIWHNEQWYFSVVDVVRVLTLWRHDSIV